MERCEGVQKVYNHVKKCIFSLLLQTSFKLVAFLPQSDVKRTLQEVEEQLALKETSMRESLTSFTKEKDKLLCISMERGKVIQVNKKSICSAH